MPDPIAENVADRFQKLAMAVRLRNVAGRDWGWFSREDPRMHLQTQRGRPELKVWLENKGKRICEASSTALAGKDLKKVQAAVEKNRAELEEEWAAFVLQNGWYTATISGSNLVIVLYPGHNQYERVVDLKKDAPGMYGPNVINGWDEVPPIVLADVDHARLAVGSKEKAKTDPDGLRTYKLAPIMFED